MSHGSVSLTVPAHESRLSVDINPSTANADMQLVYVELDDVTLPSDIIASVEQTLKQKRVISPVGVHYDPEVAKLDGDLDDIADQEISGVTLWNLNSTSIIYDIANDKYRI